MQKQDQVILAVSLKKVVPTTFSGVVIDENLNMETIT